ncbi:hypothetical protein [Niastella sp. OAS944]|uniref:hypothetical protein n=1 Tax=Niastella sp. OAS944 TaxID=2664089 RepID=UPI00348F3CE3|nr:hypothetical protein [Chitinophagaceae bacterium OAS944]
MPVHIFVVDETNYEVCIRKGLAAIPSSEKPAIQDGLISRMAGIRPDDLILFYVIGKKELRGVFRAVEGPFHDNRQVWQLTEKEQLYPLRVRVDNWKYSFEVPIKLSDIYDLRDNGKIWTFSLRRPSSPASNVMFSISEHEFDELLNLYLKFNPVYSHPKKIREPYPYLESNLHALLNCDKSTYDPKYEYTLMSLLSFSFANGKFKEIFGDYSDYLSYIPTSFEKEIDMILISNHPINQKQIIAYNIIEVKRDVFDEKGLSQLLQYEDWFLKKKVKGDYNMIRTTAIAKSFDPVVIDYLKRRKTYENKYLSLLQYNNDKTGLTLQKVPY